MRLFTFLTLAGLLATANSRPIVQRRAAIGGIILETTSLESDLPSATLDTFPSPTGDSTDVDPSSTPSATSSAQDPLPTDPSLANSTILASTLATDVPTSVASSADPSVTDPTDPGDTTDTLSTPTQTANGTDFSTLTADSTATATGSTSFTIPTAPPACVAVFSSPSTAASSTLSAEPSQNTTLPDPSDTSDSSDNSTVIDTSLTATATATDSSSVSATATATATASGSVSTGSASATPSVLGSSAGSAPSPQPTGVTPFVSVNPTITKRIAQEDLPDVAQAWQDLCLVSGGDIFTDEPCVILAGVNGINALLANSDPCDQQDNADAMIDYARSPGVANTNELIANAIAYRKHPRNALNIEGIIPSTPYCQRAPRNPELVGIVNDQLDGVNPGIFGGPSFGLVAFGDPSSCPFGTSPNVETCDCE